MSRRFGRNQKRKLRDLIAGLERKLYSEYERATGKFPDVADLVGPVLESEVTESQKGNHKAKEADLTVYWSKPDGVIREMMIAQHRPLVEHDGYVWRLWEIIVEDDRRYGDSIYGGRNGRYEYIGGPPSVTLKLKAEPNRIRY